MKLLLDTHVFPWWVTDSSRLDARARALLRDPENELLWSVASSWEVATKFALGRLSLPVEPAPFLREQRELNGVSLLAVEEAHVFASANLPRHHTDPFDRLLVAQARLERVALVTFDRALEAYDFPRAP